MSHPVETFSAIVDGTRSMLELARRRGAASFVYVSSMEIYGMGNKQRGTEQLLDESAVGYIDPEMRVVDLDQAIPGFYGHASNVLISYALIVVYGLIRLVMGAGLRELAIVTAVVIAANYFYEAALTLWNTKDLADAHWGAVSSLLTFALLAAIKLYGLKPATVAAPGSVART